jgi:hypothetical protein
MWQISTFLSLLVLVSYSDEAYQAGTPGGPWTEEEIRIVQDKVRIMVNPKLAKELFEDTEKFPPIVDLAFGNVWHPDDPDNDWFNASFSRAHPEFAASTRKLIRLAFHDCLKNVDAAGNRFGGCDGCLNWREMDAMHEVPYGNMAHTNPVWPSYRALPVPYQADNNKLSTTVMALEWIYTDTAWPPGSPLLATSLEMTGKSRADLWQLATNTALEIEIAKANYGCSNKVSFQQQVLALEGLDKCLIRLHKPIPFQYGRVDCVKDPVQAKTDFPFEATNEESHSNPHGKASAVLEDLKRDFGLTARQSIALMATHAMATHSHNKILGIEYRWAGNPFLSNMYFKILASRPLFDLEAGLAQSSGKGVLAGDKFGQPLSRDVQGNFQFSCYEWWNTTTRDDSGPCFFRPMTTNAPHSSPDWDLLPRIPCFKWDYDLEDFVRLDEPEYCADENITIDRDTGVQYGGIAKHNSQSWAFTFFLNYEMNFMKDFEMGSENRPRGCNLPDVYPGWDDPDTKPEATEVGRVPIDCSRASFKLPGESQTSADIVEAFADDHEVWTKEFLDGWEIIQKNGYGDSLMDGPEISWLGYSLLPEGSEISFPLLFTDDLDFDLEPYLMRAKGGLGTVATS